MATNIFSIGQSALQAAMAAQATTSHNISNATTPGYNRQVVVQSTAGGINYGYGFVGQGTQVAEIKRVYNDFLVKQQLASQTTASSLDSYYSQISQLDNLLADSDAGLSPALQDFFKAVQNLASNPNTDASRQSVLSMASTLVARFQSLNDQMAQSRTSVNNQITSTVSTVNSYAAQLSELNKAIVKAQGAGGGQAPNDLLDQRDQVIAEINKYVKVSIVPQDSGAVSVFIGSGQPLVMGDQVTTLVATPSVDDVSRLQIGYPVAGGKTAIIPDSFFYDGGSLGGLLKYRTETLDPAQNSLGRIATILGSTFNDQQKLGLDQNGVAGTDFFNIAKPAVSGKSTNSATASMTATITNASALTTSDYTLSYDGTNYTVTRLSDNTQTVINPAAVPAPVVDGVSYSGVTMAAGDSFRIKPTVDGAAQLSLALNNTQLIAAAAPIVTGGNAASSVGLTTAGNTGSGVTSNTALDTSVFVQGSTLGFAVTTGGGGQLQLTGTWAGVTPAPSIIVTAPDGTSSTVAAGTAFDYVPGSTLSSGGVSFTLSGTPATGDNFNFAPVAGNKGTASISAGSVDSSYLASPLTAPVKMTYSTTAPVGFAISPAVPAAGGVITHKDGTTTPIAGGATSLPYVPGDSYTFGGMTFAISGQPANGDQFTISPNTNGTADNRNALLLAGLQTKNTIGNTTYQGSYSQLVATIGNKTNEINVTNTAEKARLASITAEQQSESGVNQDEELANMIKNQQQYQAAAKIIQAASDMLNVLFTLGN
ncbi:MULTISPECIES: flagellar hook-associated protein FlgK [unclassified Herbaspirillum]|uniref:flagellar hook-associated protein FlgK n=1 Tax=unclassified Herbaspirillum TaxID=2624150 RepID=UPI0011534F8D|nr:MULTISPECIES: flagellar hook-associated protein FlgK [unclassified Herbaspirillum]MBB5392916.1 flagellar hook-associated protein 1 FlgK [Herbaspirillum sp. SJZ102]TQK04438.1 flagellar hook-associated protein 1 FlgK [Herbaspirillum sp. SJZ130]TQK09777.1 flagellar hook-associated protein 1 FlgK [Herbaspirillum sp. SJZ106]TWC65873.1 flagellar hook-associated protein 1 FlgK [Herbaspirillum sp. SJZ099]